MRWIDNRIHCTCFILPQASVHMSRILLSIRQPHMHFTDVLYLDMSILLGFL
ncbi:hypothetical protein Mapa_006293 [Marchantia paleacea]|nr:hypothetical protein Mapa_006293 [Marchantia paleacea]